MTPEERVAAIRKRVQRATGGPWKWIAERTGCTDHWRMESVDWKHEEGDPIVIFDCSFVDYGCGGTPPEDYDAEFIAHSPDDIAWLLDEHLRLSVALDAAHLALQADTHNFELARDTLAENKRLRAVVELAREMPPTVEDHGDGWFTCRECGAYSVHAEFEHDEHCTSQRLQAALRALDGGAE